MASLAVAVLALAGLAALRTKGSRLPLWSSGLAAVTLGLGSIAFPSEASSIGPWAGLLRSPGGRRSSDSACTQRLRPSNSVASRPASSSAASSGAT